MIWLIILYLFSEFSQFDVLFTIDGTSKMLIYRILEEHFTAKLQKMATKALGLFFHYLFVSLNLFNIMLLTGNVGGIMKMWFWFK